MSPKLLVIDADKPSAETLCALLTRAGYDARMALTAGDGLRKAYQLQPDLILLEANLPDRDGWAVCKRLRDLSDMPIFFLSARAEPADIVKGLALGADDYVAKPYDDGELVARVQARLRRSSRSRISEELAFNNGELRINFINREVWMRGRPQRLTPKEFNLLAALARNAGRVMSRVELATEAWGDEYSDAFDSLKLYIHYLRRKLEANPQQPEYILTARGVGYRFRQR